MICEESNKDAPFALVVNGKTLDIALRSDIRDYFLQLAVNRASVICCRDVCMPVMDGLQATRLIHSFEETGNWDAAMNTGIEQHMPPSDSSPNGQEFQLSTKRIPIIAVSTLTLVAA
ncbi:hypothetical protein F0562_007534 [Nyssa sinensis]|uniref:Uncharacterized protein n=1 Tax=Nyssa sinensis TaxID=561372 RepID=A0A5J5A5Z3_9ASTE|nr:hypothetical protein F0562_007534 [Nyssa sinensis]